MNRTTAMEKIESLIEPICAAHGLELVQVKLTQGKGAVLQVFIDREFAAPHVNGVAVAHASGVTVDDCKLVSRDVSTLLDVHEELLPGRYHLEVSSPGLDRPLVRLRDFERFCGSEVKVEVRPPIGDRKRFHGTLLGVDGEDVRLLEPPDSDDGTEVRIPHPLITKANVVFRF